MNESALQWLERYVLLYESPLSARDKTTEFFAAHNAYADAFHARYPDRLLMIGPFAESEKGHIGAMSIFTSHEAAEEFAESDPFVVNEVVSTWRVRKWLVSATD